MAEEKTPTVNELLLQASEALDEAYKTAAGVTPAQRAFVDLLRERSKDVYAGGDVFAAKDTFDPGKG